MYIMEVLSFITITYVMRVLFSFVNVWVYEFINLPITPTGTIIIYIYIYIYIFVMYIMCIYTSIWIGISRQTEREVDR